MRFLFCLACVVGSLNAFARGGGDGYSGAAVYWVPVETSLQQFAVFEISAQLTKSSSGTRIKYTLPLELTGVENEIELEGPIAVAGQPLILRGSLGRMECPNETLARCSVTYDGLQFDNEALRTRLTKISANADELTARLQVAMGFGGEPHGFLHLLGAGSDVD